jgi:hypothetical protein
MIFGRIATSISWSSSGGRGAELARFGGMEREVSPVFGGRKLDMRTPKELSRYFREEVLSTASVQYVEVSSGES